MIGNGERDSLAYELARSEFDAVERGGLRARWSDDNTRIEVVNLETGEVSGVYNAEDLVRAESDREVRNARTGSSP